MAISDWLDTDRVYAWEELIAGRLYVNTEHSPSNERGCAVGIVVALRQLGNDETYVMYLSDTFWHDGPNGDPFDDDDPQYRPQLLDSEYFDEEGFYMVRGRVNWGEVENLIAEVALGKDREQLSS